MKNYRKTILALLLLIGTLRLGAQEFSRIDSFARSVELNRLTLPQLTDSLTNRYPADLEKVRSIFVWIAHNIAYDYEKRDINQSDTSAYLTNPLFEDKSLIKNILERKKGICYDYSFLFRAMCTLAGIESKLVQGYAKTSYKEIGFIPSSTNHAWNAVYIAGKWRLLDVTWASERRYHDLFVEELEEGYFLTPPSTLILDHLPEDEQWQLLKKKVDKQQFFDFPNISSNYLKYNVQGFSPDNGFIPADGQEVTISIKIPQTEREVRLVEGSQLLSDMIPLYENGSYKFVYSVTEETESDNISVAIQNDEGSFDIVVTYKLAGE